MGQKKNPLVYVGIAILFLGVILVSINQSEEVIVTHIVDDS